MLRKICIALIFIFLIVTGCLNSSPPSNNNNATESRLISADEQFTVTPEMRKEFLEKQWMLYSDQSIIGEAYRHRASAPNRNIIFDFALEFYWLANGVPAQGSCPEEIVSILEYESYIPFWPIDCETSELLTVIDSPDEIISWKDIYIEIADNGFFDYTYLVYDAFEPYTSYPGTYDKSEYFTGLSTEFSVEMPDGSYEMIERSTDKGDAFQNLISALFSHMIRESFIVNNANVPVTLDELLSERFIINSDGWGLPADTQFEYGVDPVVNGVYLNFVKSSGDEHTLYYRFVPTEIEGDEIYDITEFYVRELDGSIFLNRIPLLTDELFASPPPEL